MKSIRLIMLVTTMFLHCAVFALTDSFADSSGGDVVIVSLFSPDYPKLARSAGVTGDVELKLEIRSDGSVASAIVVNGHPLLKEAALSSALRSRFECRACDNQVIQYLLTYSFQLVASPDWPCPEAAAQRVSQTQNHVIVTAEPVAMHINFANVRVRSAKCIYLWKCDSRWTGEDYYYDRVPSLKCLNLWSCGLRLREPWATCKRLNRELVH
jgi:TonB family protein